MRHILALIWLIIAAASVFGQSNSVEKADSKPIVGCFSKAVIIVPSENIDPLMIVKPSEKLDSGILIEILCPGEFLINRNAEIFSPPAAPETNKKP